MTIPGHIDPVPVPRPAFVGDDARVDLVGRSRDEIRDALVEAGLELKQAKLRAKQIWHQIYNRGATEFEAMSDIAKPQRSWLAERFVIGRPDVVVQQVSTDGTRKWLLKTRDGHDFEMVFIPDADRERSAFPARSAAPSIAASAIRGRCGSSAISILPKLSVR